jgi:hypothetical protein
MPVRGRIAIAACSGPWSTAFSLLTHLRNGVSINSAALPHNAGPPPRCSAPFGRAVRIAFQTRNQAGLLRRRLGRSKSDPFGGLAPAFSARALVVATRSRVLLKIVGAWTPLERSLETFACPARNP